MTLDEFKKLDRVGQAQYMCRTWPERFEMGFMLDDYGFVSLCDTMTKPCKVDIWKIDDNVVLAIKREMVDQKVLTPENKCE